MKQLNLFSFPDQPELTNDAAVRQGSPLWWQSLVRGPRSLWDDGKAEPLGRQSLTAAQLRMFPELDYPFARQGGEH